MSETSPQRLRRELGLFGAVMMGLGAMVGTGVFVSIGLGAGIVGPAVIVCLVLAAGVALCNGLSSAQLAAAHPVSGGTYEYGYLYLGPWAGFTAGWVFLVAKSASAATAALGFSGYLLHALGAGPALLVPTALTTVAAVTVVVLSGMRRSNVVNAVIVSVTLASLVCFVAAGSAAVDARNLVPFFGGRANDGFGIAALLETTALMFVAYTGYARIATLGEEIKEPRKTIPKAIVASVFVAMALYVAVAIVGVGVAGSDVLLAATEQQAAPLAVIAERFSMPISGDVLVIGGLTAMLGVLLNLALGLSRVVLAMARRGDLPAALGRLSAKGVTPPWAVLLVAAVVALLVAIGDVGTTWSLSAFSVLIYYALTNLAALRMPPDRRRYPRWVAGLGLVASIVLAFWIETQVLAAGVCALLIGLAWRAMIRRRSRP